MAKKKAKRTTRPIISGYLERVSAQVLEKYKKEISEMIQGHQGLYALYRRNNLYYVGLASDLRRRINQHLKDRHGGKWTHFSLYIIRKTDHIKELESMLLRIAYPEGNAQRGKLRKASNLLPQLKVQVKRKIKDEYEGLFPTRQRRSIPKPITKTKKTTSTRPKGDKPLKGFFKKRTRIYAPYKGEVHVGIVFSTGTVKYNGQLYNSPSAAGCAVKNGKATNGWSFWKFKNKQGELVPLASLRK